MIHPTAIIDPRAKLAPDVKVGPYTVIGADVEIGEGSEIDSHVVIKGPTRIGKFNRIYQFASIGEVSQDKKYKGDQTWLEIGDYNTIREFCTFNRGTGQESGGVTKIGNHNLFLAYVHIAHDCIVGNHVIFSNNASLAGHVIVDDFAILSGMSGVHQFCHIGAYSFAAGGSMIAQDVPPFVLVSGYLAKPYGINVEGLKRHKFSTERIADIKRMYKIIYRNNMTLKEAIDAIKTEFSNSEDATLLLHHLEKTERGIVR